MHEVMSSWDREAAEKSKQESEDREDDTPQVDRRHFGSSGSGSEAPLRLDMSTDFFANVSSMATTPDTTLHRPDALESSLQIVLTAVLVVHAARTRRVYA